MRCWIQYETRWCDILGKPLRALHSSSNTVLMTSRWNTRPGSAREECVSVKVWERTAEGYGFCILTIFCSGWHHTWANLKWNNMYFSISVAWKSYNSHPPVETVTLTAVTQTLSGKSLFFFLFLTFLVACGFHCFVWTISITAGRWHPKVNRFYKLSGGSTHPAGIVRQKITHAWAFGLQRDLKAE